MMDAIMHSLQANKCLAMVVVRRSTPWLVLAALACGDGSTDPKIPFPMPDVTGTWRVDLSAAGVLTVDGNSNDSTYGATFTGVAELRLLQ